MTRHFVAAVAVCAVALFSAADAAAQQGVGQNAYGYQWGNSYNKGD